MAFQPIETKVLTSPSKLRKTTNMSDAHTPEPLVHYAEKYLDAGILLKELVLGGSLTFCKIMKRDRDVPIRYRDNHCPMACPEGTESIGQVIVKRGIMARRGFSGLLGEKKQLFIKH